MTSDLSDAEIRQLVVDTESNIKKIEAYHADFVCVALNEWRYATRHIIDMAFGEATEDNRVQAVCHLKRAYFDSSDILLNCLLERFEDLHSEFSYYSNCVSGIVKDYSKNLQFAREAQEFHASAKTFKNREDLYDQIKNLCDRLEVFVKELEATADDWRALIRKQRNRDRIIFWGFIFGIIVAIPTLMSFGKAIAKCFSE